MTPRAKPIKPKKEVKPTKYIVLEHITSDLTAGAFSGDGEVSQDVIDNLPEGMWVEIGWAVRINKREAIAEVVGARSGRFKAVAEASWKGGRVKRQRTLDEDIPEDKAEEVGEDG